MKKGKIDVLVFSRSGFEYDARDKRVMLKLHGKERLKIVLKQRAADQDAREISGSLYRGEKNIGY